MTPVGTYKFLLKFKMFGNPQQWEVCYSKLNIGNAMYRNVKFNREKNVGTYKFSGELE